MVRLTDKRFNKIWKEWRDVLALWMENPNLTLEQVIIIYGEKRKNKKGER